MALLYKIKSYFDLRRQAASARALSERKQYILPQYFILIAGIIVQPFLENYMKTNEWSFSIHGVLGRSLFGVIMGIIIFPGVYRNAWDNRSPIVVQLCSIFVAGIGWQTLFASAINGLQSS